MKPDTEAELDRIRRARKARESAKAQKPNGPSSENPDIYSVDTLRTEVFPTLKQIAGEIIVEGLTLLAARPKIGKTWLMLEVAVAVDQGSYCLGDLKCERGDVLFLALEDNPRRMQRRLTKLLGVNKAQWPRFACAHTWPRANAGGLDRIRDWIEQHKETARLVVIDVLARFRKPVPNGKQSYDADYEAIADLQKVAGDSSVAIVVIHHTRKGEADDPIDAVSGTLGLAGAADAVLVIGHKAEGVQLYGRSRDVDVIDKTIKFDKAKCRWFVLGETADVRRSAARQAIINALASGPMALKEIAKLIGKPVNTVFMLLQKMAENGEITRFARGIYSLTRSTGMDGNGGMDENAGNAGNVISSFPSIPAPPIRPRPRETFRVIDTAPGATCVHCKVADNTVMKIKPDTVGAKSEPLHAECAAHWFSGGPA